MLTQRKYSLLIFFIVCLSLFGASVGGQQDNSVRPLQQTRTAATRDDTGVPNGLSADIRQIKADVGILKEKKKIGDPDVWAPLLATVLVAFGGWYTTLYVFRRSQDTQKWVLDRQTGERIEESLRDALTLFGGGSQKRSLGLALMAAYWDARLPAIKRAWKNVLVAQAIYLLTESEERDNLLEIENLRIIINHLKELIDDLSREQRANVIDALDRAERDPRGKKTKEHPNGAPVGVTTDKRYLDDWRLLLLSVKATAPYLGR